MLPGHLWGRVGVEVAEALKLISLGAMTDAWSAAPPGVITARTAATADLGVSPHVDWFVYDITPLEYRTGGAPGNAPRVLGLHLQCLLTVGQSPSGAVDADALTAFGAIVGRVHDSPLRIAASTVFGGAMVLQLERQNVPWVELRDAFETSGRPLARGALYRVMVQQSLAAPDVVAPVEPARIVVIHGGTPEVRRRAVDAVTDGPVAEVGVGPAGSKWIGETEKSLAAVFATAERSGAVLLFDEADALFGKRSGVRDAHDRYASLQVGNLPAGTTVILTVADAAIAKRLAAGGAEVIEVPDE